MAVILFLSQGVPMLVAGDEFGRTQEGNNNAWCQDNEISWVNWKLLDKNRILFDFFRKLIRLRLDHPVFRRDDFLFLLIRRMILPISMRSSGRDRKQVNRTGRRQARPLRLS